MFPGQIPPAPKEKIWAVAYMDNQTECFEINTCTDETENGKYALFHKEYSIGTAIADFLTVDLGKWNAQKEELQKRCDAINAEENAEKNIAYIHSCTQYWLRQSALFLPFSASLERLRMKHEQGEKLTLDECSRQMKYYKELQPRLTTLAHAFFEAEQPQDMRALYFKRQEEQGLEMYPMLSFSKVTFGGGYKGVNGIYPYDDWLDTTQKVDAEGFITEILETENPNEFVDFILYRYLTENVRFRTCKFCGRYFGIVGNPKIEYCDRLIDGSTKTCRETGSYRIYTKHKMEEPAIREYKRSYKAHNARIRYGLMTREEFNAWSLEAREKRDLCVAGKLSLDEFVAWLDSDKM